MTTTNTTLEALQAFSDRYAELSVREVRPFVEGLVKVMNAAAIEQLMRLWFGPCFRGSKKYMITFIVEAIERRVITHQRTKRI